HAPIIAPRFSLLLFPPYSSPFPTRRSSDLAINRTGIGVVGFLDPDEELPELDESGEAKAGVVATPKRVGGFGSNHPGGANFAFGDRKSTRLNSSHDQISYAVFCLKKKKTKT